MNLHRIYASAFRLLGSITLSAAGLLPAGLQAQYQPIIESANIAPTVTATAGSAKVNVIGEPRQTKGHPCTLWDAQDIAYYKDLLKKSGTFRDYFAKFRADMDKRIAEPLGVPEPKKGPDGQWMFLGDDELYKGKTGAASYFGRNGRLSRDVGNLATAYALTGEAKYGEFAKAILLAYANNYASYGYPGGKPRYRSAVDGRLTGQFLEDGGWLIPIAFGYDLTYNLPSWTPEEREKIRKDLFNEIINQFRSERFKGITYLNDANNRSAIYAAATLIAGYGTEDAAMVNDGLYGTGGTKEKPTGGVFGAFFTSQCMLPDGLWSETIGYQITIAGSALINHAEVLWHHGIDLYRYKNSVLKRIFDTPIEMAYPDAEISIPEMGDTTSRLPISTGIDSVIYEYAYRRYGDPRYLPIIAKLRKSLSIGAHQPPPTIYWEPIAEAPAARQMENVNFFDLGIGILRLPAGGGWNQLTLIAGPSRGHEHPDRLAVELFAQGDVVAPDPGVIFPYQDPLDGKWYQTTFAHCGLTVDEQTQITFGNIYQHRGAAVPEAKQLVYAPGTTIGLQRAWTNTVHPGIDMDRAVFFTTEYMADLFGAFSQTPHTYDLVWHLRGQMSSDIPFKPHTFPEPVSNGYNALTETQRADSTGKPWWATFSRNGKEVRLFGAGGPAAEIFAGKGHYRGELGYSAKDDFPPTVFERRAKDPATVFGSAIDVSGASGGFIKAIAQEGGLATGYALLNIQTVRGIDTCFAAYRPGLHKTARLETDAQQACVTMDGVNVKSLYLAGGKTLKTSAGAIVRGEPGLACVEQLPNGSWVVCNPSPTQAEITVNVPAQGISKTVRLAPGESAPLR